MASTLKSIELTMLNAIELIKILQPPPFKQKFCTKAAAKTKKTVLRKKQKNQM
jgi:hypothetical protein